MREMVVSKKNQWNINLSNEYGSIGEKVAKKWLHENGYEIYNFREIISNIRQLPYLKRRLKRRRKKDNIEIDKRLISKSEEFLSGIFGERIEDIKKYDKTLGRLEKEESDIRLARNYKRVGIGPDFIVKKDGEIFYIEIKVNESQPKKYQRISFQLAKEHGFKTMILRLSVQIIVQKDIRVRLC